jgi:hypothetical protein
MVQAGTQVMNDLPAKNAEAPWDDSVRVKFNRFLDGVRIIIGDSWVRTTFKKDPDFSFEIEDVLVGPF